MERGRSPSYIGASEVTELSTFLIPRLLSLVLIPVMGIVILGTGMLNLADV
jgi:hypothetical protein